MPKNKVQKMTDVMRSKWEDIKNLQSQVVEEDREFTADERKTIEETLDEVREIEVQIEKERAEKALHDEIDGFDAIFAEEQKTASGNGQDPRKKSSGRPKGRTNGEIFAESQEWLKWFESVAPNGRIPDSLKGISSPPVSFPGLFKKALITGSSDTSAGAFVVPEDSGIYEPLGRYPLVLRDLISIRRTTSDAVEFVRQVLQVTQATPVAEANVTEYSGATGEVSGEKPEGTMTFVRVQEAVKTIAVWIPATKRALSDAGQLSGIIDDELTDDLAEEFENQLLNGDGTGENFTGLANTSGVLAQAFDTDIAVTARKAVTNLLVNGRQIPTAFLFNPQDWESYDLLQDSNGRYYWGGPVRQGPPTLWGLPVAQSFLQGQGTGWLGNWRKMVVWDREDANISVSDSHEDFFIRNMVAILAEMRAAMGVIRPSAFVEVDLTSGS